MFCYQCEQTARGTGCTSFGVCGKDPETALLQDLLVEVAKGASQYAHRARALGVVDEQTDRAVVEALFTTVTNVNFDAEKLAARITRMAATRDRIRSLYEDACAVAGQVPDQPEGPARLIPGQTLQEMVRQGGNVGIALRLDARGEDVVGLQELLLYGVKGSAAYADHALILGQADQDIFGYFHEALDFLTRPDTTVDELLAMCLTCGEVNLKVMELLDRANTGAYGTPVPTPVRITPVKGKAILVSGHDLKDLELLLKQTEGTGINIYTHGEMLPAHGYPELKRYPHLAGNYGGAWQDQQEEFDAFPGAVLMTTNCIQKPRIGYTDRIFTSGLVAWPGVNHIPDGNFEPVIQAALAAPGFAENGVESTILTGFGHGAVLGVADKIIEAVKTGEIRHFFLIGGCDGARPGRNYYTEFAEQVPDDCVVLTLACGKFRFNKHDFGTVAGLPRLLDIGQCNDAYSAIRIASALAEAFACGINELPLSMILSWYEQKAVCILLTLLHLGVKNIRLGPTLPAFLSPAVVDVLVQNFNLAPIGEVQADMEACFAR
ncbi:MAG: hydroxylamine reductase [Kiritimatiellae bacterium]|nr:hydroxylamine reductase [Kiritimatiellia bacterium]